MSVKLTSSELKATSEASGKQMKGPMGVSYKAGLDRQRKLEKVEIMKHKGCPRGVDPNKVGSFLTSVDGKKLSDAVDSQFYDGTVLETTACMTNSFIGDPSEGEIYAQRIRNFLTDPKIFGSDSVNGFVMSGSFETRPKVVAKGIFVIKAPRDSKEFDDLVHECIVGFKGTNPLRLKGIPNFAYIYGAFFCSSPMINEEKGNNEIISFCNTSKTPVCYAVYEKIASSPGCPEAQSMNKYVETHSAKQICDAILGTCVALYSASSIEFSHLDLHGENVILRHFSGGTKTVKYPMPGGNDWYLEVEGVIPTIIDYGSSHIKVNGKNYGHVTDHFDVYTPLGIRRDVYNPLHDQFRMLCGILAGIRRNNPKAYRQVVGLLKFFTDENPDSFLKNASVLYNSLAWNKRFKKFDSTGFISHIAHHYDRMGWTFPLTDKHNTKYPILDCGKLCSSTLTKIGNSSVPVNEMDVTIPDVVTMFDFYNSLTNLRKSTSPYKTRMAKAIKEQFRGKFDKCYFDEVTKAEKLFMELSEQENMALVNFPNNYMDLLDERYKNAYKKKVSNIGKYFDTLQRLNDIKRMFQFAVDEYKIGKDQSIYINIGVISDTFKAVSQTTNNAILSLDNDVARVHSIPYEARMKGGFVYYENTLGTLLETIKAIRV